VKVRGNCRKDRPNREYRIESERIDRISAHKVGDSKSAESRRATTEYHSPEPSINSR
jgi:hypothetical protein